jgi:crossover junction endodeoxyribonuclease RusA
MTVEIEFPLEFIVQGTPVSFQAKRPDTKKAWQRCVKDASTMVLPRGHLSTDAAMSVTIFFFPDAEMEGDLDNIIKPILDALCQHVYKDDRQVERVWVQKFEPGKVFPFRTPSNALADALQGEKPLLYVRLSDDPTEGLT